MPPKRIAGLPFQFCVSIMSVCLDLKYAGKLFQISQYKTIANEPVSTTKKVKKRKKKIKVVLT